MQHFNTTSLASINSDNWQVADFRTNQCY